MPRSLVSQDIRTATFVQLYFETCPPQSERFNGGPGEQILGRRADHRQQSLVDAKCAAPMPPRDQTGLNDADRGSYQGRVFITGVRWTPISWYWGRLLAVALLIGGVALHFWVDREIKRRASRLPPPPAFSGCRGVWMTPARVVITSPDRGVCRRIPRVSAGPPATDDRADPLLSSSAAQELRPLGNARDWIGLLESIPRGEATHFNEIDLEQGPGVVFDPGRRLERAVTPRRLVPSAPQPVVAHRTRPGHPVLERFLQMEATGELDGVTGTKVIAPEQPWARITISGVSSTASTRSCLPAAPPGRDPSASVNPFPHPAGQG